MRIGFFFETRRVRPLAGPALVDVAAPGLRQVREGLRVGVAVDRAQPRLAILDEPIGIRLLDVLELFFQRHRTTVLNRAVGTYRGAPFAWRKLALASDSDPDWYR